MPHDLYVRMPWRPGANRELRRGELVEVRSAAEILATLDDTERSEGLPFMPEMLAHIGRRFTVEARVERACDTINKGGRVRRMRQTRPARRPALRRLGPRRLRRGVPPVLEGGVAAQVADSGETGNVAPAAGAGADRALEDLARRTRDACRGRTSRLPLPGDGVRRGVGGARLVGFAIVLARGHVRQRRVCCDSSRSARGSSYEEIRRRLGLWSYPVKSTGRREDRPARSSTSRPGTRVRIRPADEISETLDATLKTRGSGSTGRCFRTAAARAGSTGRVERFIDEGSGRMIELKSECVILDGVFCKGHLSEGRWFCPRAIYSWWRDDWLERAEAETRLTIGASTSED